MKQKLMILGASFSYIGCIKAAREMGLHVVVADRNPASVGFEYADTALATDISDPEACLADARRLGIDGIVAVNDFGVITASVVASELGLPGLPIEVARIATDKMEMRRVWLEKGAPTVRFREAASPAELADAVAELGLPVIIKPRDSRGGGCRGVMAVDERTNLEQAFHWSDSFYRDGRILVEEMVTGLEHSVEAIVYQGQAHVVAVSDKVKSPLPFRVDDTILYPSIEKGEDLARLRRAVQQSVETIGMTEGIAHVELCSTARGPVLFEIGARCGGGAPAPLVPYLSGVEEFKEAARLALGRAPVNLEPLHEKGCVIKFLYPEPGIVESVEMPPGIEARPGVLSFGVFVGPGDEVRPLRTCGDRAGMVITGAENVDQARRLAEQTLAEVKVVTRPRERVAS